MDGFISIDGLKTFINYFEQQNNSDFNTNDLVIFQRYLHLMKLQEIKSRKQKTLDLFFNN